MSWAVPTGPSLDITDKRMGVHAEDHPLGYGGFRGPFRIGSTVLGRWRPGTRACGSRRSILTKDLCDGETRLVMSGQRLHGTFSLVGRSPSPTSAGGRTIGC